MESVSHTIWHIVGSPVNVNYSLAARNRGKVSSLVFITSLPSFFISPGHRRPLDTQKCLFLSQPFAEYILMTKDKDGEWGSHDRLKKHLTRNAVKQMKSWSVFKNSISIP